MQRFNINLLKNRKKIFSFSSLLVFLSLLGILYSNFYSTFKYPINLGMDFVGGNELRIERVCDEECSYFSPDLVLEDLIKVSKNKSLFKNAKLQLINIYTYSIFNN